MFLSVVMTETRDTTRTWRKAPLELVPFKLRQRAYLFKALP